MKERWIEISPDSNEKQEGLFTRAIEAEDVVFKNDEAKEAYQNRFTLVKDAIQLKKVPERIPLWPMAGTFPLEYTGTTWKDAMYNYDKLALAYEKYISDFPDSDFLDAGGAVTPGRVLDILDFKLCLWAGHGLPDDKEYQYVEKEYLQADEYQDFIDDPTGWFLNVYFPRIFGALDGFKNFPIPAIVNEIIVVPSLTIPFVTPPLASAMEKLLEAGKESLVWVETIGRLSMLFKSKGYIALEGAFAKAPFDILGDTLRGTKEIMMDLFRRPDEVIEACERILPLMVKSGAKARLTGNICMIPLHKGADGFMSEEQFRTFYWPTLRKLAIGLIDQGIVPILFAEGSYDSRLDIISDLPRGKAVWYFDRTDMKRAKETVGKNSCIMGNVPLDLLYAGTKDEVREYCRELIDVAGKDGGYIFATGAGMQGTKAENVKAMMDFASEYAVY
ncbi:uroporphyrinogen decarboxylase family protein [Thermodesulfobacteriota bacterium]